MRGSHLATQDRAIVDHDATGFYVTHEFTGAPDVDTLAGLGRANHVITIQAQQGQWAPADDATAKFILDAERQWEEAACDHNKSTETILADDFWGTTPEGTRYGKAEEVKDTEDPSKSARECRISDTKVCLFGDNLATVYGRGFSVRKGKDGRDAPRCLIFADTWLKRNGKWQIVAAHDAQLPCGE